MCFDAYLLNDIINLAKQFKGTQKLKSKKKETAQKERNDEWNDLIIGDGWWKYSNGNKASTKK